MIAEEKFTLLPIHTGLAEAAMVILTGWVAITVMPMAFEVAGLPVTQLSEEVNTQVILSPLAGA